MTETSTFQKQAEKSGLNSERLAFIDMVAANPLAGDMIHGTEKTFTDVVDSGRIKHLR